MTKMGKPAVDENYEPSFEAKYRNDAKRATDEGLKAGAR